MPFRREGSARSSSPIFQRKRARAHEPQFDNAADYGKYIEALNTPNDILYCLSELGDTDDEEYKEGIVKRVHITGIPINRVYKGLHSLHWRTTLECTPKDDIHKRVYISIEVGPDQTIIERFRLKHKSVPVIAMVQLQKYGHHNRAPDGAKFTFYIAENITITLKNVVDMLQMNGRHKFRLDAEGNGCLMWSRALLSDMKGSQWLESGPDENTNYANLNLIKKDDVIGNCIVRDGVGTFFK